MGVFSVVVDSFMHVVSVLLVTSLFCLSFLRRFVLLLPRQNRPFLKRIQLVALYCEVPIVRRAVQQFGVATCFPQMINELSWGTLKTTVLSMQPGVVRAPFCFVPSLPHNVEEARLPASVNALKQEFEKVRIELDCLLDLKVPFDLFFGTWFTYDFWLYGEKKAQHAQACPETYRLLSQIETLLHNSQCGFSKLAAEDRIGNHCDAHSTNLRLRVHLGLRGCNTECYLVEGQRKKTWTEGSLMVLDTTFQHYAVNNSEEDRYVLLFDIWHPSLKKDDIEALKRLDRFFDH